MKKNKIKKHFKNDGIVWKGRKAYSGKDLKILHGHYIHYRDDGTINLEGTWINGQREGAWKMYHDDESLFARGFFKNGDKFPNEWAWEYFDESGKKMFEEVGDPSRFPTK